MEQIRPSKIERIHSAIADWCGGDPADLALALTLINPREDPRNVVRSVRDAALCEMDGITDVEIAKAIVDLVECRQQLGLSHQSE